MIAALSCAAVISACAGRTAPPVRTVGDYVLQAGHPTLAEWLIVDAPTSPANNHPTPARIELGRGLFFDSILSTNEDRSCANCHDPARMWTDGRTTALGLDDRSLPRATPSLINVGYAEPIMWDGRSPNLEHQALLPILNEREMGGDVEVVLERLNSSSYYRPKFAAAYAADEILTNHVSRALAAFQRTLVSRSTDFDRWVAGDASAMSEAEVSGFEVFVSPEKGRCAVCHAPPLFTDHSFHNIGLSSSSSGELDVGRYAVKPIAALKGAFRTPQLRELDATAPYFHDGSAATIAEAIDHYDSGFETGPHLSREMRALSLTTQDKANLASFLMSLRSSQVDQENNSYALQGSAQKEN